MPERELEKEHPNISSIENERRLMEAERLAKMGSWELDLANDVLHWSDEIYRIFETTPQSFGATYEAFLSFVHPEDRELVHDAYKLSLEEKKPYGPITHRLIMRDGNVKFVEERGFTEYDESDQPVRSLGIVQDITERVLGEQTRAELKEKEILLKEIYHRVKNNLQLVSSLISIQESQITNEEIKTLFQTCRNRIATISIIHEQLYRSSNLANIKIREHMLSLIRNIENSYGNGKDVSFRIDVVDASLPMNDAVSYGLILNEILTNCFQHAFGEKGGTITVKVEQNANNWRLQVKDDGKGVEDISIITQSGNFGIDIINSLVEQLDGELQIQSAPNKGVHYDITFKTQT